MPSLMRSTVSNQIRTDLKSRIEHYKELIDRFGELNKEIEYLENEKETLARSESDLISQLEESKSEYGKLPAEYNLLNQRILQLENEKKNHQEELKSSNKFEEKVRHLNLKIKELESDKMILMNSNTSLKSCNEKLKEEIDERVRSFSADLDYSRILNQYNKRLELKKKLENLKSDLKKREDKCLIIEKELNDLKKSFNIPFDVLTIYVEDRIMLILIKKDKNGINYPFNPINENLKPKYGFKDKDILNELPKNLEKSILAVISETDTDSDSCLDELDTKRKIQKQQLKNYNHSECSAIDQIGHNKGIPKYVHKGDEDQVVGIFKSRGKANGRMVRQGPYGGIYYEIPHLFKKILLKLRKVKINGYELQCLSKLIGLQRNISIDFHQYLGFLIKIF
ncbi:hypothetical protein BpHYR1_023110 [Brachionus plicatilis]|uniref:Uncharacterized protein n=1 Tax=Brachionus plicatilis TaxID=10195 RepID=A0A3M7SQ98_BRAPC|nr:hypothetical protein BpHYR1_023110 [Brachionus plicatilis]